MKKRPTPKESLARNLQYLMDTDKLSEMALAKRSGVAQKTINNILNQESAPNLDTVDKLSSSFGLNLWHLVMPDLPEELIKSRGIEKLYDSYTHASKEGRDLIERMAEREASYSNKSNNS